MNATLIVLDVDDTLYLERDYVRSGFDAVGAAVLAEHGVPGFAEQAWATFLEGVRGSVFDRVLADLGISHDERAVRELVDVYRSHEPRIRLAEDVPGFLDSAIADGAALAIVTDGPSRSQWAKVRALGLDAWTQSIIVTEDHGPTWHKPAMAAFKHLQSEAGVSAGECVYIADNPVKDFAGPLALGWDAVRIRRPLGLHAGNPESGGANRVIETLAGEFGASQTPRNRDVEDATR